MAVDYNSYYKEMMNNLKKKANEATKKALDDSYTDYFKILKVKLQEMYKSIIDDFYADYKPKTFEYKDDNGNTVTYHYERRGSLYNLLQTETFRAKNGKMVLKYGFDPSQIVSRTGYNEEDGLYDTVFRHGWHGGARHNDSFYWRTPVPTFKFWGTEAKQANISPLDAFNNKVDQYYESKYQTDFNKIWEYHKNKIKISW